VALVVSKRNKTLTPEDFSSVEQVTDKGLELTHRLLRYVDMEVAYAVHALSACRGFDYAIYKTLGQTLDFHTTRPSFQVLTQFSFVWPSKRGEEGRYRIHDLLRRLLAEHGDQREVIHDAHAAMERYYRERATAGDRTAIAEALYHSNRLDLERGIKEWVGTISEAARVTNYDLCRALLEVRGELTIRTDFQRGQIFQSEGDYYAVLSHYDAADQAYQEAIRLYDAVLRVAPDYAETHSNRGRALLHLGVVQAELSQHEVAISSYIEAVAACDTALRLTANDVEVHTN
jgi:tetratricopeptide (TPR) repeat protein